MKSYFSLSLLISFLFLISFKSLSAAPAIAVGGGGGLVLPSGVSAAALGPNMVQTTSAGIPAGTWDPTKCPSGIPHCPGLEETQAVPDLFLILSLAVQPTALTTSEPPPPPAVKNLTWPEIIELIRILGGNWEKLLDPPNKPTKMNKLKYALAKLLQRIAAGNGGKGLDPQDIGGVDVSEFIAYLIAEIEALIGKGKVPKDMIASLRLRLQALKDLKPKTLARLVQFILDQKLGGLIKLLLADESLVEMKNLLLSLLKAVQDLIQLTGSPEEIARKKAAIGERIVDAWNKYALGDPGAKTDPEKEGYQGGNAAAAKAAAKAKAAAGQKTGMAPPSKKPATPKKPPSGVRTRGEGSDREEYDPKTKSWKPSPVEEEAMGTTAPGGQLASATTAAGEEPLPGRWGTIRVSGNMVEIYNPKTGVWTPFSIFAGDPSALTTADPGAIKEGNSVAFQAGQGRTIELRGLGDANAQVGDVCSTRNVKINQSRCAHTLEGVHVYVIPSEGEVAVSNFLANPPCDAI